MKFQAIAAYFMFMSSAAAQMAPPFAEGDGVFDQPGVNKCMSAEIFKDMLNKRQMHIMIMSDHGDITKVIFVNKEGSVVVSNMFKEGKVCIADIIDNAHFSSEIHLSKPQPEEGGQ